MWLKYISLLQLQDGKFKGAETEDSYRLAGAIFVFAGGTAENFIGVLVPVDLALAAVVLLAPLVRHFIEEGRIYEAVELVDINGAGAEVNAGLAAMIAEAFAVQNQLLSGSDASIEAMTERLGIGKGHLTSLVRLSYLAPDIVRALLKGRQPVELTPTRLLRLSKDLPHDWSEQGQFLGKAIR